MTGSTPTVWAKIFSCASVSDKHLPYVRKIKDILAQQDIRVVADERSNTIGYQIREAHNMKIPYSIIIGDKEVETNTVSIRDRKQNTKNNIPLDISAYYRHPTTYHRHAGSESRYFPDGMHIA